VARRRINADNKKVGKMKKAEIKKQIIQPVSPEVIQNKIFFIRNKKVMLDRDLSMLYCVSTKVLNQAVKRNIQRFPSDFMFQLSQKESSVLRSQTVTLEQGQYSKYAPYAFTELGIAMLSSVLKSEKAIQINIWIMRAFNKMRKILLDYEELKQKISIIENKHNKQAVLDGYLFEAVFKDIRRINKLFDSPKNSGSKIGFKDRKKSKTIK